jgi:large subunit ribosomal protein L53
MITRYLTDVTARFNPFSPRAKTARLFLSKIPAAARLQLKVTATVLPRTSPEKPMLNVKFSAFYIQM